MEGQGHRVADSSLMDVQSAQLPGCPVPPAAGCFALGPSSSQWLIYGPCLLPSLSSAITQLHEAHTPSSKRSLIMMTPNPLFSRVSNAWDPYGIETAIGGGTCDSCPQSPVPSAHMFTLSACLLPDQAICRTEGRPPTSRAWNQAGAGHKHRCLSVTRSSPQPVRASWFMYS